MTTLAKVFDLSTPAKRFRFIAVLEAITWVILLVSMIVKYGAGNEDAVFVPGMLHGIVFVLYVLMSLVTARMLRWTPTVTLLALVASIPPFGSVIFEWWAQRERHMAELSRTTDELTASPA